MSNLVSELLLRLVKPGIAAVLGLLLYWLATGPLATPGSVSLALLCWIAASAFILLVETGLI